jgi:hypothetical protein
VNEGRSVRPSFTLVPYEDSLRADWDSLVANHPLASDGHHSAQFALARAAAATNVSVMVYDGTRPIGVFPLFEVRERELRYVPIRTLRSGFAFPAGPLVESKAKQAQQPLVRELVEEARHIAARRRCDRLWIDEPTIAGGEIAIDRYGYLPLRAFGFAERNVVSLVLDFRGGTDPERERGRTCRQLIRKAHDAGATVERIVTREAWLASEELNVQTLGPMAYSRAQLEVIWDEFLAPGLASAFACSLGGIVGSVVTTIHGRTSTYYWLSFNRRPLPVQGMCHAALASAIDHARRRGSCFFELGSKEFSDRKQLGISQFKESFGGRPCYGMCSVLVRRRVKRALLDGVRSLLLAS